MTASVGFLLLLPLALQGVAMIFDEFYFHRKRGLPKWERLGHPMDTLTVLACYLWVLSRSFTPHNALIFVALAGFSCLFVTKDEFVHKSECTAAEMWLHAILFVLHPVTFFSVGLIWAAEGEIEQLHNALYAQVGLILFFLLYQIIYWSFVWTRKKS